VTYDPEALTGAEVRTARKRHKLTMPEFSRRAGLPGASTSRLTGIERMDAWQAGDREKVARLLRELDGLPAADPVDLAIDPISDEEWEEYLAEAGPDPDELDLGHLMVDDRRVRGEVLVDPTPDPDYSDDPGDPGDPTIPEGTYAVSNSLVQSFKRCRRQWWLSWFRRLALRVETFVGVRATGDRVHRALAAYYVPDPAQAVDPRTALEREVVADWTKIYNLAVERGLDEVQVEGLTAEFAKSTNLERAIVEGYVQWLAETGEDSQLEVIGSEKALVAPLELPSGRPAAAVGLLDVRAIYRVDGTRRFVDHKVVQELTTPQLTLPQNEQMLHYHLLEFLTTEDADERCDGALYNMLRRVKRTARANPPFYDRVLVPHNRYEIEAYRENLAAATDEILDVVERLERGESHQTAAYPSRRPSCKHDCDFYAVCRLFDDGSRAEAMLSALYHEVDTHARYFARDGVSL
jgi:hypothetical protein